MDKYSLLRWEFQNPRVKEIEPMALRWLLILWISRLQAYILSKNN